MIKTSEKEIKAYCFILTLFFSHSLLVVKVLLSFWCSGLQSRKCISSRNVMCDYKARKF